LMAVLFSYYLLGSMLGYAAPVKVPNKFIFIAYNVVIKHNHKEYIEIWIQEPGKTRLVVTKYTKSSEAAFKEAADKAGKHQGSLVQMKKKAKEKKKSDDLSDIDDDDFESNVLTPEETMPKDPQ